MQIDAFGSCADLPSCHPSHHPEPQVDPLVSAWCPAVQPQTSPVFEAAKSALAEVTPEGLALIDGFSRAALLPSSAPGLGEVAFPPAVHLVVSRMPPRGAHAAAPGAADPAFASLMLHGWLFESFAASDRKAHQKFPLLSLHRPHSLLPSPSGGLDPPVWLPTTGAFGWADQHVHRDEPVDLGGFLFAEVFFGSDMARVGIADPSLPSMAWVVAVDSEDVRGIVALCVFLPDSDHSPADASADTELKAAVSPANVATALRRRYGADAEVIAAEVEILG
jgi:hypothetical protein